MPSMVQARMASSAEMLAVFEDRTLIENALAFEAALAKAEAECGVGRILFDDGNFGARLAPLDQVREVEARWSGAEDGNMHAGDLTG